MVILAMQPNGIAAIETRGTTLVLGCCTFDWSEANGRRVVVMPEGVHATCVAELERAATALGIIVRFIRRDASP